MSDLQVRLRQVPILSDLEAAILDRLTATALSRRLAAGEVLFRQGDKPDALWIVLEGELEAVLERENDADLVLSRIAAGDLAGEIQVLTGGPRTATVRCRLDAGLAGWPRGVLDELAGEYPGIVRRIARAVHERLRRDQLVEILPRLIGSVDDQVLRDFETMIEWVRLARGEQLFEEGEPGDCLYLVVSGRLRAVVGRRGPDGGRVVGEIGRGEVVGEMAVFTGEQRTASVVAMRDSELARISKADFETCVQKHPGLLTMITRMLVHRLRQHTSASVESESASNVVVVPLGPDVPIAEFTRRLVAALAASDRTMHVSSASLQRHLQVDEASRLPEDGAFDLRVAAWLEQLESQNRFLVYETDHARTAWTRMALGRADQLLLVANAADSPRPGETERTLDEAEGSVTAARRRLVLLHADGSGLPRGTGDWLSGRSLEMHHHVRWGEDEDFARLGRLLGGRAVALVLGGGGARGMAHIGVIRALVEAGVPIDMIGGTSAGGVIATQFAMGFDADTMSARNREAFLVRKPFNDFTLPIVSIIGAGRMTRLCQEMYGAANIEDLWINSFCVSCNISTSETVVHRTGPVWKAVRATSALPGIAVPVVDRNHLLVDGGVVDNLPGQIMKRLSGGHVILVDVSPQNELQVSVDEIPATRKILWSKLARRQKPVDLPSIMDVIVRTCMISSVRRREEARSEALLYLHPPIDRFKLLGFDDFDSIVDAGYRHAKQMLERWERRDEFVGLVRTPDRPPSS